MDTKRWAEVNEEVEIKGKVFVQEERGSVVDERGGCRKGAKPIITKIASGALVICVLLEMGVKGLEELLEKDKTGKCNREESPWGEPSSCAK